MRYIISNILSSTLTSLLVVCLLLLPGSAMSQDNALSIHLEPQSVRASVGSSFSVDVMVDGLDAGEFVYNLSIVIDYDADVVGIEQPNFGGDVQEYFGSFMTDRGFMTISQGVQTGMLKPLPDAGLAGRNVERYFFGAAVSRTSGGIPGLDEFPFQGPGGRLLRIRFTVTGKEPTDSTPLLFVAAKTEASDRDGNSFVLTLGNADVALPVMLCGFGAVRQLKGNKIFWEVVFQVNNLGWNVYRSESRHGNFVKINGSLIKAADKAKYSFVDRDTEPGKPYFYYIEDVAFDGKKYRTPAFQLNPSAAAIWGAVKQTALR